MSDYGEVEGLTGGKHVFACHNFLDYSGEARKTNININIEETMAILTRFVFLNTKLIISLNSF